MSDIRVALTTSAHLVLGPMPEQFRQLNLPICCAEIGLGMFGYSESEKEKEELVVGQLCKEMAKEVFIDIEKKWVFIGVDHNDNETGLIDYTEQNNGECAKDFFTFWEKTHTLMLEFRAFNALPMIFENKIMDPQMGSGKTFSPLPNISDLFCIKGIWLINHWHSLEILPSSKITIVSTFPQ